MSQEPQPVPPDPARELERVEHLLACFQQALGHELPNHLVAIQGMALQVETEAGTALSADARVCLEGLIRSTRRVHELVEALADIGRACRKRESAAEVALEELRQEAAAEVNWLYPGRAVRYDWVQPLPILFVPPDNARRVLREVFLQAVRRCPAEQPVRIEMTTTDADGIIEVRIVDDGPILTPLQQQQALNPFAGATADPEAALGLFLARQLAEGWGGSLRLEPGLDRGAVVVLTIPGRSHREDLPT